MPIKAFNLTIIIINYLDFIYKYIFLVMFKYIIYFTIVKLIDCLELKTIIDILNLFFYNTIFCFSK